MVSDRGADSVITAIYLLHDSHLFAIMGDAASSITLMPRCLSDGIFHRELYRHDASDV